uniref:novel immune-type receptor 10a isoform 2 precursor n=1 Tax=Danio rerio TaxID=7955 RepID=UPI003D9CA949
MLHISAAALLLFGMGFLKVMVSTANIQAQPGETVPMWCSHSIHVSGDLYWFKQTDGAVPITIAKMLFTESLQKVKPNYFNDYTKDRLVMNQSIKSTLLTIINVTTSDSGFYFCGFMGYPLKFGNGTSLEVKAHAEKHSSTTIKTTTAVSRSEKNDIRISKNDHDECQVSTEESSRDIFFKLTFLFGGIIIFTCVVPLIWGIMRVQKQQKHQKVTEVKTPQHDDKENDSVEYAAVHFANKRPKSSRRHAEDSVCTVSVYTDAT